VFYIQFYYFIVILDGPLGKPSNPCSEGRTGGHKDSEGCGADIKLLGC